jgi:osmoprotectant transport system permease protein
MTAIPAPVARRVQAPTVVLLALILVALILALPSLTPVFHWLFPDLPRPMYERATFVELTLDHLALVVAASVPVIVVGIALGIFVTRPSGRDFAGVVNTLTAIGQTFPPSAVLAIAVPLVGYGASPTIVALIAYGILPVVDSTIVGLRAVSVSANDAATGMGFTPLQRLRSIELPLAAPAILSGVRTSVIISIGTATIGSTVGALTLGSPIIEGLSGSNVAYVIQGALVVGLLAITVDQAFAWADRRLRAWAE